MSISAHRVDLRCKLTVLFELEPVRDLGQTLVLHVALLENQRCVLFHALSSLMAFAVLGFFNLDLLNRHKLLALKLKVKLDCFARFLCNDIIELTSEVLAGEGKVLGQHNLAEDVLAIGLLHTSLVVIG